MVLNIINLKTIELFKKRFLIIIIHIKTSETRKYSINLKPNKKSLPFVFHLNYFITIKIISKFILFLNFVIQ